MSKTYYIEACTNDAMQDAVINQTLRNDKAGGNFCTAEKAFSAAADFCTRLDIRSDAVTINWRDQCSD